MKTFSGKFLLVTVLIWISFSAAQNLRAQPDANSTVDNSGLQTELPSDVDPNSSLAQIIRLAQSGVSESVLTSYANNSAAPFNLTAGQIIYLKDIGVPDSVVQAMIQRDQQLGVSDNTQPPANPAPNTTVVTTTGFYDTLAPYGGWVNIEGYGMCWRPSVVIYDSNWQPYCDHGQWLYTDDGWFWISDYSWGWATFHYGRWFHNARYGWCWWPDTQWAPSWVCWRYSNDYCGWAPLPPHSEYRAGVGFVYNGVRVGAGFDFGIGVNFFTFVPAEHFCDPHPRHFRVDRDRAPEIFRQTTIVNNYNVQNHVVVNHGIDPSHIEGVTHQPIHRVDIHETSSPVARGEELGRDQTLFVNRPQFNQSIADQLHKGQPPHREFPAENAPRQFDNNPHAVPGENNFHQPAENSQSGTGIQRMTPNQAFQKIPENSQRQYFNNPQQPSANQPNHSVPQNDFQRRDENVPHESQPQIPQQHPQFGAPAQAPSSTPENRPSQNQNQNQEQPRQNYFYNRSSSDDNRSYQSPRAREQSPRVIVPQTQQPVQQQPRQQTPSGNQQSQWQKDKYGH